MNSRSHYDVAIIGAGMSGLAAGIRLAHFGKRVCIFERHNAPGGLNSFYSLDGRKYDVGLHALTNFTRAHVKGAPLGRILRQLRIERDELDLAEQRGSRIAFGPRGERSLRFANDPEVLTNEIAKKFPREIDGWRALLAALPDYDELSSNGAGTASAREFVGRHLHDPLLIDMIFCPLMFYGSAQEHDMDLAQFAIMARSIFLEGFARPLEGVRAIIRVLLEKYRAAGGERRMKCGVARIVASADRATALVLDNGEEVTAGHIISSIGAPETERLIESENTKSEVPVGRLSFVETIAILNRQPDELGWGSDTIIFFNDSECFDYSRPAEQVDVRSGVICFPNNFDYAGGQKLTEGVLRVTCLANYDLWAGLPEEVYRRDKARWFSEIQRSALRFLAPLPTSDALDRIMVATDMFTPRTVHKFTGHIAGAIYGSPQKFRDSRTSLSNLYLCGTDQGFLGIVGAMLSGITVANTHVLRSAS